MYFMLSLRRLPLFFLFCLIGFASAKAYGQGPEKEPASGAAPRGSIVEDRAAKKLLEAGDARNDAAETQKALEVWKSVIERYPRSKVRFDAHLRLGNFYLVKDRSYDRARTHFEAAAAEDNSDDEQRAEATLKVGVCYYQARNYGKCFQILRDVIEKFPVSPQVNEAYYYIGLGHFQLGHYSRAITALEKVGTTLADREQQQPKLQAGKRFFVKIEDADLAVLDIGEAVEVQCKTTGGDTEVTKCFPVGRNVRLVLGSLPTRLGRPIPGNGTLEVKGGDQVEVTYSDAHTADKQLNRAVLQQVKVVGDAIVAVTDGAFGETLRGVVLEKSVNVRVTDADRDVSDAADTLTAVVEVLRPKTDEEIQAELTALLAKSDPSKPPVALDDSDPSSQINKLKPIDRVQVTLTEAKQVAASPQRNESATSTNTEPAATPMASPTEKKDAAEDTTIHSGTFHVTVPLVKAEQVNATDDVLQALPGDVIRVIYQDEISSREEVRQATADAKCLEGNIGGVRVTKAVISDQELRIQTQLKTADALANIGNRYKEFGLREKADEKYAQALTVCEEILPEARQLGGSFLEQTYVALWKIYFERDNLDLAAAMCQRLQTEFPNSGFVDDALLQLGEVARKQGQLNRAIGIFTRLVAMQTSQLRGEAQFGLASCYEQMATAAEGPAATQLQDRSFQEFKKVYDQFPDSGRVGEAVAKMANYYYQQKDFSRAIDTFETVLANHPDAKFLDVILFNYGRCLYRLERKADAKRRFDQLLAEFPESPLAADAKKISEALAKAGM